MTKNKEMYSKSGTFEKMQEKNFITFDELPGTYKDLDFSMYSVDGMEDERGITICMDNEKGFEIVFLVDDTECYFVRSETYRIEELQKEYKVSEIRMELKNQDGFILIY